MIELSGAFCWVGISWTPKRIFMDLLVDKGGATLDNMKVAYLLIIRDDIKLQRLCRKGNFIQC